MGMYINPREQSKEAWLLSHAVQYTCEDPTQMPEDPNYVWVCLVHNPAFTAAAVAYNREEFERFSRNTDLRQKEWFQVHKDEVKTVVSGYEQSFLE